MEGEVTRVVRSPLDFLAGPFAACKDYNPDGEAYVTMLRVAKVYTIAIWWRSCLCGVYPVHAGWEVKH